MKAWQFISCAVLLMGLQSAAVGAERPNFVIFIADDLGRLDTEPYGSEEVRTPNITRLAKAGLRFNHTFVASPSCAPSRAALLTGLMPARNGAEANHSKPRPEIKKLPAYLQELGYEVVSFGKVAHYNHGKDYGFDRVSNEGFQNYAAVPAAAKYLAERESEKPLCLMVGTHWPHVPWPDNDGYDPAKVTLPPTHIDTDETREARSKYLSAVTKCDDDLGVIYDAALKHLDARKTYLFFTSDHGGQWPFGKWNLYDAGIHVPLFAVGPGIEAGSTTDAMVSWIDILPTLVELAGEPLSRRDHAANAKIDGRSFAAVLRDPSAKHRDEIFATHSGDGRFNVYPIRCVRDARWKYILNLHPEYQHATHINRAAAGDGISYFRSWEKAARSDPAAAAIVGRYKQRPNEELYDLAADPHEQNNLAAKPEHAERLAAMRARVVAWMKEQGDSGRVFSEPLLLNQDATPILPLRKNK